jgi:hypothetical protein
MIESHQEWISPDEFEKLKELLEGVGVRDWTAELLTPEELAEHKANLQSIVDARAYAEAHAHEIWIGS